VKLEVHWDKVVRVSQTATTLQAVVNPPLRRGTPVHDNAYKAVHDLGPTTSAMFPGCLIRSWEWRNWNHPRTGKRRGISR